MSNLDNTIMDLDNSNNTRNFNLEVNKNKKQQCKYFNTKNGCKNGSSCSYSHILNKNWRDNVKIELSPEEEIEEEIKFAIINKSLNNIFKKMLSSNEDYNKYYWDMEKQFRGIAIWKLIKKSIKKDLIDSIYCRDVEIDIKLDDGTVDQGILPYGYIPLCLFFIFNGLAWKIFDGAKDLSSHLEIESCINDVIDIISSLYTNEEYKDVIKTMILYCNPVTYATIGHISTGYLCDSILSHIKTQLSQEDFDDFVSKTTSDNQTIEKGTMRDPSKKQTLKNVRLDGIEVKYGLYLDRSNFILKK